MMVGGSVTVPVAMNADGSPSLSGTGLALVHATALISARTPAGYVPLPTVGQTTSPFVPAAPCTSGMIASRKAALQAIYNGAAAEANLVAPAWVTYITGHAAVSVPAAGLLDSGGHACTGTAAGTVT